MRAGVIPGSGIGRRGTAGGKPERAGGRTASRRVPRIYGFGSNRRSLFMSCSTFLRLAAFALPLPWLAFPSSGLDGKEKDRWDPEGYVVRVPLLEAPPRID